jgi:hypothetical protein
MRSGLEHKVFPQYKVRFSSYHGGGMEGPSLQNVMEHGVSLFETISTFIKETYQKPEECEGVEMIETSVEEIEQTCEMYGRMASLMDSMFSKFYAPRGTVTPELLTTLRAELLVAMQMWDKMQLSLTPKWHTLLNHAWKILKKLGGFADMLEDRIEHNHQRRYTDDARLIRVRNPDQVKRSQAKFQHARVIAGVIAIQKRVKDKSKRKNGKLVSMGEERSNIKKAKRTERRQDSVRWANLQDDDKILQKPKDALVQDYKLKVEMKNNMDEGKDDS